MKPRAPGVSRHRRVRQMVDAGVYFLYRDERWLVS